MLVKRALSEESSYEISSKLLRNSEEALLILARLYFFQFLHNTISLALCVVAIALYQHTESVVPKTEHVVPAEYWGADSLAQRECYQGYQGVPTYRVSGTKD